jgi:hypothetical protein
MNMDTTHCLSLNQNQKCSTGRVIGRRSFFDQARPAQGLLVGYVWLLINPVQPFAHGQAISRPAPANYREDRILIKPKRNVSIAAVAGLHAKAGSRLLRAWPAIGNLQVLEVPRGVKPQSLIAAYRQSGLVEYAEPDYLVDTLLTPNDPGYINGVL